MWQMVAPEGYTISVAFSSGTTTSSDYLVFYDGDQTNSPIATDGKLIGSSADLSGEFGGDGVVESTTNKFFCKYIVDRGGTGGTFTGNVTFIAP